MPNDPCRPPNKWAQFDAEQLRDIAARKGLMTRAHANDWFEHALRRYLAHHEEQEKTK